MNFKNKLKLCWKIIRNSESNLYYHAEQEMDRAWPVKNDDEMQEWIKHDILEMVEVFSTQGHSGSSAPYVITLLDRLLRYKTIGPLTGNDDEWNLVGDNGLHGKLYQNNRVSSIFKDDRGAYDIDRVYFIESTEKYGDSTFTSSAGTIKIKFPYDPPQSIGIKVEVDHTSDDLRQAVIDHGLEPI